MGRATRVSGHHADGLLAPILAVSLGLAFAAAAACPDPDPLQLTRAGADVHLRWTADAGAAGGYSVYRVPDKAALPGLLGGPEHLRVGLPLPVFPVADPDAVSSPWGVLYYQVYPRCAVPCLPGSDRDGDRLDDCVETLTGVFNGAGDTGTDPTDADSDDDGISDGDEVLGTVAGLDLPALGASPVHKDIFLEYDWFDDGIDCGQHSHRPTQAMLDRVSATFAVAPVANPDRTSGIRVHHDFGQGAPYTGGNLIADADGVLVGGVNSAEFRAHKLANFDPRRQGYFHYVMLPHFYNTDSTSSGQAEFLGNDLIVSLYCNRTTSSVGNTIVHELGHNLGLRHGGDTNCNYKPNYDSVMNYLFQFPGVDRDCDAEGDLVADYSHGTNLSLDENDLDESRGVCGSTAIDWDGDRRIEAGVVRDLNNGNNGGCGGTLSVIGDHDDWAALDLTGVVDGDFALQPVEVVDCDNPAPSR